MRGELAGDPRVEALGAVAGQHDDGGTRRGAAHAGDDVGRTGAGHADVEQDDVGLERGGQPQRVAAVARLAHDLEPRIGVEGVTQ